MTRKRRRGFNGRRGKPRRKKPVETAPVVSMTRRAATGPRKPEERAKHQDMLDYIARTKERLAQQAERDRQFNERYADAPMIGEPVWHEHPTGKKRP